MQRYHWRFKDRRFTHWEVSAYAFKQKGETHWQCRVEAEFPGMDYGVAVYEEIIHAEEISLPRILIAYHASVSMMLLDTALAPPVPEAAPKKTDLDILQAFWKERRKELGLPRTPKFDLTMREHFRALVQFLRR